MQRSLRLITSDLSRPLTVLLLVIQLGVLASCDELRVSIHQFDSEAIVRIRDYQDRRLSDSLYATLSHTDVAYRWPAAMALASIQDTAAVQHLGTLLLQDDDRSVRQAAAYSLGQTGGK